MIMVESDSWWLPEWLQKWLKLPFYDEGEKCSTHYKQYNTNYCAACMKGPVCDICLQQFSKQHKDHPHQILRVQVASRRAGIRVKDIEKILDVSKIELYSINNGTIVYLNSKRGAASASDGAIQIKPNSCRTCQRSSQLKPGYEFCSIACKAEVKSGDMVIEKKFERKSESPSSDIDTVVAADEMIGERMPSPPPSPISTPITKTKRKGKLDVGDNNNNNNNNKINCPPQPQPQPQPLSFSFRKKSRKGIPSRAPFK